MRKSIGLLFLFFFGFFPMAYADLKSALQSGCPFQSIAVDASGTLYFTDSYSNLYKMTADGVVTNLTAAAGAPRPAMGGIAVDKHGNIYVVDCFSNVIWKTTPGGVWTILAGTKGVAGSADGTGTAASFKNPSAIAVDKSGNVYVSDGGNLLLRKITPRGVVTTLAGGGKGSGVAGGAVNGKGTAASFAGIIGVAVDKSGNVYAADSGNDSIRKISPSGMVTTLVGSAGGSYGIAVDKSGNIYAADYNNNMILKITSRGVVTTLAGSPGGKTNGGWNHSEIFIGGFADGTGTQALFHSPYGVAVDKTGNVYVADSGNDSIRKISPGTVVTTLIGSPAVKSSQPEVVSRSTYPAENCYNGFPHGIPKDQIKVDYNINFTYQPEHPKDVPKIAEIFTSFLNADAEGSGLSFVQAEGSNPNIRLYLTVSHNNTIPDHYSLSVRVNGAPAGVGKDVSADGVDLFTVYHAPFTYTDDGAGKLLEDAAKEVENNLANGWSCQ